MGTSDGSTLEQKGNDVASEAGRLGALTDELNKATASRSDEQAAVGSWLTVIGKALLAILGVSVGGRK